MTGEHRAVEAQLELQGEHLALLPERALWWPRERTLVVADLHLGKAAAFRAAGVPVPEQTTHATLARLSAAIARTGASQVLCIGDLLHARTGRTQAILDAVGAWRAAHPQITIRLVRGNHDERSGDPPAEWEIDCVNEPWRLGPFAWRHRPAVEPGCYAIAGHIHPAALLAGPGRQQLALPCFWFGAEVALLPAFGDFTGTAVIRPQPGDRVYVVAGDEVLRVPAR